MEQQAASVPVTSASASVTQGETPAASGDGMDIDVPATSVQPPGKRKASEEPEANGGASKKVRMGMISFYHSALISIDCSRLEPSDAPLKRYVLCRG